MTADVWLEETYFEWLRLDCFPTESERQDYEGTLRLLHEIPFYYAMLSDMNRAGDALSFRQSDFLGFQDGLEKLDQFWLGNWATAAPSVLEVLVAIARRWHFYFEDDVHVYFQHLFKNMGFHRYPGRHLSTRSKEGIRNLVDVWLARQFRPDGTGSPFPVRHALDVLDMRRIDIWGQMNAYSAEHFQ